MSGPLASLRVLNFSTLLPGPFATMMLADLGASVLRVEAPHRPDAVRLMPPFDGDVSAWHALLHRSKRSLTLDLKHPDAPAIIRRLVGEYDILLEQFRPGVMARLGLDYEPLRAANPRLIYCSLTGYGQDGPLRDRAGHDINYLALAGLASHLGRRASGPVPLATPLADIGGGSFGAVTAILAAVIHRQVTGEGQWIDVSMRDAAMAWNSLPLSQFLVGGEEVEREGHLLNGGSAYDFYRTADGRFLAVAPIEPKFWQTFCTLLERPDLAMRGLSPAPADQQAVKAELRPLLASQPLSHWLALFEGHEVCVEPVLTLEESIAHPQTEARAMIVEVPKGDGTSQRQVAHPYRFSATAPRYTHIGPPPGTHTDEVLTEIGYSAEQIARWHTDGAL